MPGQSLGGGFRYLFILYPSASFAIGHWTLAIGHWTLAIGHWTLAIGHRPLPSAFRSPFCFLLASEQDWRARGSAICKI